MTKSVTGGDAEEEISIKHDNKSQEKNTAKRQPVNNLQGDFWTTEDR